MARKPKLNINEHVGQKLRARRLELGLSQNAVGKGIGIAAQQVQKYEKGVNAMNAQRLYEFAQLLKMPVASFFDGLGMAAGGASAAWASGLGSRGMKTKEASDRESLEVLKSFKRIKDYALRKRIADFLRSLSLKDI